MKRNPSGTSQITLPALPLKARRGQICWPPSLALVLVPLGPFAPSSTNLASQYLAHVDFGALFGAYLTWAKLPAAGRRTAIWNFWRLTSICPVVPYCQKKRCSVGTAFSDGAAHQQSAGTGLGTLGTLQRAVRTPPPAVQRESHQGRGGECRGRRAHQSCLARGGSQPLVHTVEGGP